MPSDLTGSAARDFIEYIIKKIVGFPDDVTVTQTVDDLGVLITLKVNKEDMGKIIGKAGQTAKALRVLLRMMGSKNEARYNLKIVEPEGSERPEKKEYSDQQKEETLEVAEEKTEDIDDVPTDVLA